MAVIASSPFFVKATIKIGTDDYSGHFQGFEIVSNSTTAEVTDISGKVYKFAGPSSQTLNVGVIQDWTATGLAKKMYTDEGTAAVITIETVQGKWTVNVTLVAPTIGGQVNTVGVAQVSLPVTGKAVWAAA